MRRVRAVLLLGGLLIMPQAALAQSAPDMPAPSGRGMQTGDAVLLHIRTVMGVDEQLSGSFMVGDHGTILLPRVGTIQAAGRPAEEVRSEISQRLRAALPDETFVDVTALVRVFVFGEVRQPGRFLLPTYEATVAGALSAAQGLTPDGRTDRLVLMRDDRSVVLRVEPATRLSALLLESGDQIVVPERSWLVRNPALVPALLSGALSLVVTLLIVGTQ
jgi:polysaccharide biosynthesis/export protein